MDHDMDHAERHSHRGPKAPPRPPLPAEIPVYGPSAAAVRQVCAGLIRALPSHLRVALAADPADPVPYAIPAAAPRIQLASPGWDARERRAALAGCDLILAPGRPSPDRPGILVLDAGTPEGAAGHPDPSAFPEGTALMACVAGAHPAGLPAAVPVFGADRGAELAALVLDRLRAGAAPLYGLVLGGGRSGRMGRDKAALAYHGMSQTRRGLELLAPHCLQTFVSCRAEQAEQEAFAGLPQIHDAFLGFGPLGGILSALRAHPEAAFLVVACDLPFLDTATLAALAAGRDPLRMATAFSGPQNGLPEPLCAVYEPRTYSRALQILGQGIDCPRKLLLSSSAALLAPPDPKALRNVNDPEEYRLARSQL